MAIDISIITNDIRNKKLIRKIIYLLNLINRKETFFVAKTTEDLVDFHKNRPFQPSVKFDSRDIYLSDQGKNQLYDLALTIQELKEFGLYFSFSSICRAILKFIENLLAGTFNEISDEDAVTQILCILSENYHPYKHYRTIEGIKLLDIESLSIGNCEIFTFSENTKVYLKNECITDEDCEWFDSYLSGHIDQRFINKVCIASSTKGDKDTSEKLAFKNMMETIQILRFFIALLAWERIDEHIFNINLSHEAYDRPDFTLYSNLEDHQHGCGHGRGRQHLQFFEIGSKLISRLKECGFDDIMEITSKENKTELEKGILTSIYWIGEAQNDFIPESAFLKYWTALETLVKPEKGKEITDIVKSCITTIMSHGAYRLESVKYEHEHVLKRISYLYDLRSKIVHEGLHGSIKAKELGEICQITVNCVLNYLVVSKCGFASLKQVRVYCMNIFQSVMKDEL